MLFNSLAFLLGFAPIVFFIYFKLGNRDGQSATIWLAFASLVFYAWWAPLQTIILVLSILFNYVFGLAINKASNSPRNLKRSLLIFAITIDLVVLSYYKYAGFFVREVSAIVGLKLNLPPITLPLGISFFTFTQIAYLVDTYRGKVNESGFSRYVLFVTYFPHLIAGPVIHHGDVMPQFAIKSASRFNVTNFAVGVTLFSIGLFKKVVIADSIVTFVTPVFALAEKGAGTGLIGSWAGTLAYTLQLYFDFSGYSDMAIGLSMMLNIRLPFNFNSPYKAKNIIEFWTRWHISLSIFLRDYLYIPLGGNRCGNVRRYTNLFLTMVIGGLWHGAGWTFLVWGALHGTYIMLNHGWRHMQDQLQLPEFTRNKSFGHALTLFAVVIGWVFFRADSLQGALRMIESLAGLHSVGTWAIVDAAGSNISFLKAYLWIVPLAIIALFAPNSQEITTRMLVNSEYLSCSYKPAKEKEWRQPGLVWAVALGFIIAVSLAHISQPTQFLYFNF